MSHQLILPMAFYAIYVWLLGIQNFLTRKNAVRSGELDPKYFKTHSGSTPSERVLLVGRHYDNQFQGPMFFMVTCATFVALNEANRLTLILAWAFVFSRICHTYIHLGKNKVVARALAYGIGMTLVLGLWLQLLYFALS